MRKQGLRLSAGVVLVCFIGTYGLPAHAQQQQAQPEPPLYQPPQQPQAQPGYPQQPDYPPQPGYPQQQPGYPQQQGYPPTYVPPPAPYYPVYARPRIPIRYEYRPRIGLIIAGSVVLGVSWGITAVSGLASSTNCDIVYDTYCTAHVWPLYIPVVGPFIETAYINGNTPESAAIQALLVFDGLVQAAGLAMLIVGAATRKRVPVYADRFQISPYANRAGAGLMAVGRF